MVALHVGVLVGSVVEPVIAGRAFEPVRFSVCAVAVIAAQALRWWVIATLGSQWNIRVIVVPGLHLVTGGPFRFATHPNYIAVAVEVVALPAASGAWLTALAGTVLNALLMAVRIPCEELALGIRGTRA
jgi:methyltransferase